MVSFSSTFSFTETLLVLPEKYSTKFVRAFRELFHTSSPASFFSLRDMSLYFINSAGLTIAISKPALTAYLRKTMFNTLRASLDRPNDILLTPRAVSTCGCFFFKSFIALHVLNAAPAYSSSPVPRLKVNRSNMSLCGSISNSIVAVL